MELEALSVPKDIPILRKIDTTPMFEESAKLVTGVGELAIHREQWIPQSYLDHIADARFNKMNTTEGEFMRVASIPEGLVNHWKRQGFDVFTATAAEILKRLRLEGYDKLISTNKRIG